jgi:hypothetical protein
LRSELQKLFEGALSLLQDNEEDEEKVDELQPLIQKNDEDEEKPIGEIQNVGSKTVIIKENFSYNEPPLQKINPDIMNLTFSKDNIMIDSKMNHQYPTNENPESKRTIPDVKITRRFISKNKNKEKENNTRITTINFDQEKENLEYGNEYQSEIWEEGDLDPSTGETLTKDDIKVKEKQFKYGFRPIIKFKTEIEE